jgi:serine/threonine protein kinase
MNLENQLLGQTLAQKYEIRRVLGRGGFGLVFEATHVLLEKTVAIKILQPEVAFMGRFKQEAQTLSRLSHPNILRLYDLDMTKIGELDLLYMVMDYAPNGTLEDKIRIAPLPVRQAAHILKQVAEALDAIHAQGIFHRDIKPSNILFGAANEPLLADFGLAKFVALDDKRNSEAVGTRQYMAPEQFEGSGLGAFTDVFSLGITLHEMLVGKLPKREWHTESLVHPDPALPPELKNILHKATVHAVEARFASAGELAKAFAQFAESYAEGVALSTSTEAGNAYQTTRPPDETQTDTPASHDDVTVIPAIAPSSDNFIAQALAYTQSGNLESAATSYGEALRLQPTSVRLLCERAALWRRLNKMSLAQADYQDALKLAPEDSEVWYRLGVLYTLSEDFHAALHAYNLALRGGEQAYIYNNRGVTYYKLGEIEAAITDYNRALALNPEDTLALCNRGNARRKRGRMEDALADYDAAINLDPRLEEFYDRSLLLRGQSIDVRRQATSPSRRKAAMPTTSSSTLYPSHLYNEAGEAENLVV